MSNKPARKKKQREETKTKTNPYMPMSNTIPAKC